MLSATQGEASQERCAALLCSLLLKGKARIESQVQYDCSPGCGFLLFLEELSISELHAGDFLAFFSTQSNVMLARCANFSVEKE